MKEECKQAIITALLTSQMMSDILTFDKLICKVCDIYGTEFTAVCMVEMGLDKNF